MTLIIPHPELYSSFERWAADICRQNGGTVLPTASDWKGWAQMSGQTGVFPNYINPTPYTDWKEWASQMLTINTNL